MLPFREASRDIAMGLDSSSVTGHASNKACPRVTVGNTVYHSAEQGGEKEICYDTAPTLMDSPVHEHMWGTPQGAPKSQRKA